MVFASWSNAIPMGLAFVAVVLLGAFAGAINGFIITGLKVNAFIATLGTASLYTGLTALFDHSSPIAANKGGFEFIGSSKWFGVPISVYMLAVAVVIGMLVLARTVYGRTVYAVGGNREAARLAGMRVDVVRASTFVLTGMCAAVAGMIMASVIGDGAPGVGGDVTLNSIAIVIIGGTSLLGGEGAMWRTIVGLLIFATINNLFDSLAWPTAAQQVALGGIVLTAVSLDAFTRSRRRSGG